jgi:hypothetical protein
VIAILCSRYGAGIAPDSVNYLAAARDLAAGRAPTGWNGDPFVFWPPIYPTLLALLLAAGSPASGATLLVNATAFGLTVWGTGRVVERRTGRRELAVLAAGVVLICPVLLRVATIAWSEPLYVALTLATLAALSEHLESRAVAPLLLAAATAGLAVLTRYIGLVLVIAAVPLVLRGAGIPLARRVRYALVYLAISLLPVAAWVARNALLTGTLTGRRSWSSVAAHPPLFISPFSLVGWVGLAVLALIGLRAALRRGGGAGGIGAFALALAVYLAGVLYFAFRGASNPLDFRLLSPAVVPAIVLAAMLASRWGIVPRRLHPFLLIGTGAALLFLVTAKRTARMVREGAGGYATSAWAGSGLVRRLEHRDGPGRLYSNTPDALDYWAGMHAEYTPAKFIGFSSRIDATAIARFCEQVASGEGPAYLAWFWIAPYDGLLVPLDELRESVGLELTASFSEGELYRINSCEGRAAERHALSGPRHGASVPDRPLVGGGSESHVHRENRGSIHRG